MTTHVNTVVIGAGQAGLAVSYHLTQQARDHLVLEQSDGPADAWRNHRWDSFALNTPNWQSQLPGADDRGADPDGFKSRDEIVAYLEQYAARFQLPIRYRTRVEKIERLGRWGSYLVTNHDGSSIVARNVVVATGLHQKPKTPAFSTDFPIGIRQLHSDAYRNPNSLLLGAVLVVGSAQSGAQIAEELRESGRRVYLAVGRAGRTPRRYRGKDANWWSDKLGIYAQTVDQLPSPKAKFAGKPHISGTKGGHTLNLHQFARDGVILLGHLQGFHDGKIALAPDLYENLARADQHAADFAHDPRRQSLRWLVEQQELRIGHESTGDRQHLLLAPGQRAAALQRSLAESRKQRVGALAEVGGCRPETLDKPRQSATDQDHASAIPRR